MKDREVNSAIKRASPRRRPWAKFNASPPFPPPTPRNSWPLSFSSSLSHSVPIKFWWLLSHFFFFPRLSSFFPFFLPLSRYPIFETITLAGIQRDEIPSATILVSLAICPPTLAVPHIFYRVRLCKARLADTRKSEQIPRPEIRILLHISPPLRKKSRKGWEQCAHCACLFKTIESFSRKYYHPKNIILQENIENLSHFYVSMINSMYVVLFIFFSLRVFSPVLTFLKPNFHITKYNRTSTSNSFVLAFAIMYKIPLYNFVSNSKTSQIP